jgi:hypothetical protein
MSDQPFYPIGRSWRPASVVVAIMIMLALVGVGLTTARVAAAPRYWMALVPVYGLLCIFTAWARARHDPKVSRPGILRQVFHWLGIAAALLLDFTIRQTGEETAAAASYNALLLLSVGCYLAGVHLEWLFAVVGGLLMLALIVVVKADQYVWLIFVAGGLAIAAMFGFRFLIARSRKSKAPATMPPVSS